MRKIFRKIFREVKEQFVLALCNFESFIRLSVPSIPLTEMLTFLFLLPSCLHHSVMLLGMSNMCLVGSVFLLFNINICLSARFSVSVSVSVSVFISVFVSVSVSASVSNISLATDLIFLIFVNFYGKLIFMI
jgi:hypothetical protein